MVLSNLPKGEARVYNFIVAENHNYFVGPLDVFQIIRLNEKENYWATVDGIDANLLNEDQQNLLHEAVTYGRVELGIDLISRGVNINHRDKNGQTPLHYAAIHNQVELAKAIVVAGGDLSIRDNFGNAPLWTATFNAKGNYELVKLYKDSGGEPNLKNNSGKSPLDFAQQISDKNLLRIFSE